VLSGRTRGNGQIRIQEFLSQHWEALLCCGGDGALAKAAQRTHWWCPKAAWIWAWAPCSQCSWLGRCLEQVDQITFWWYWLNGGRMHFDCQYNFDIAKLVWPKIWDILNLFSHEEPKNCCTVGCAALSALLSAQCNQWLTVAYFLLYCHGMARWGFACGRESENFGLILHTSYVVIHAQEAS